MNLLVVLSSRRQKLIADEVTRQNNSHPYLRELRHRGTASSRRLLGQAASTASGSDSSRPGLAGKSQAYALNFDRANQSNVRRMELGRLRGSKLVELGGNG